MRLLTRFVFFATLALILSLAHALPEPKDMLENAKRDTDLKPRNEDFVLEARDDDFTLEKRACVKKGCKCNKVTRGQYCGWCSAVKDWGERVDGHYPWFSVYECNPQGAVAIMGIGGNVRRRGGLRRVPFRCAWCSLVWGWGLGRGSDVFL